MNYSIDKSKLESAFSVPVDIVDRHIRLASGNQLKVILWILRNPAENINVDKMCKALKIGREDADDCLQYWILTGMLKQNEPSADLSDIQKPIKFVPESKKEKEKIPDPAPSKPTSEEIAQRIEEAPEIGNLMIEAQGRLGKTIGYDGQCTLLLLHDRYGLPTEVLFMLIEYCVSVGKTNYSYIEAVGKDWGEREIDSLDKAAEQIASLKNSNRLWSEFAKYAGLTTARPTLKQVEYLRRWSEEWKFSDDMILKAYDEAANYTGKLSFGYMNKVLAGWHNEGYSASSQVDAAKAERAKEKTEQVNAESSYDVDEFKNRSLHGKLKYERKKKE